MRVFLFSLQSISAASVFTIGEILTLPFPDLRNKWFRLTLPGIISFLEENLSLFDLNDEIERQSYNTNHQTISLYKEKLRRVNSND